MLLDPLKVGQPAYGNPSITVSPGLTALKFIVDAWGSP